MVLSAVSIVNRSICANFAAVAIKLDLQELRGTYLLKLETFELGPEGLDGLLDHGRLNLVAASGDL